MTDYTLLEKQIESAVEEKLNIPFKVVIRDRAVEEHTLTAHEQVQVRRFGSSIRRRAWLKGRRALKQLLKSFGQSNDLDNLTFPNPHFSLTHSGNVAIAIGHPSFQCRGIGIDLEISRPMNTQAARFFLTLRESKNLNPLTTLRLWTTKEALYKADPLNRQHRLKDYRIQNPNAWNGSAFVRNEKLHYFSQQALNGFLSVAVYF